MLVILQRPARPIKTLSSSKCLTIKEIYNTHVTRVVLSIALQLTLSGSYNKMCHYIIYIFHYVQLTTNTPTGQQDDSFNIQTVYTATTLTDCLRIVATK